MLPWLEVDRLVTLFVLITSGLELIIFSDEQLRISTADNSQTQRPHIIRRHGQLSLRYQRQIYQPISCTARAATVENLL